jgi:endonuclease/exonuclease/phosphatase family metal-dependent hydrolase
MSGARTLTVLTLNIWNRGGPWEERLAVIRAGLAAMRPDVICLQEVLALDDFDQARLIAEGTDYHIAFGSDGADHYLFGNAILSRWPITRTVVRALPRGGTDENRAVTFAALATPWGTLPVFTTHLNWKLHHGHVRVQQVRELVAFIDQETDEAQLPAVLGGDFNAEADSDEIRYLRGLTGLGGECVYFCDCWSAAGDGTPGATFVRRNAYARNDQEPDRRIDYVFVRGPNERLEGVARQCALAFDEPVDGVWASDHIGVLATIIV